MKKKNAYMWLVGGMDIFTGILLLLVPLPTLKLMGLSQMPLEPVFTSWIGVFVFSVGCAYWLPFHEGRPEVRSIQQRFALKFTSLARCCVGLFVVRSIWLAGLEIGWGLVALVDLACAFYQLSLLKEAV